MVLILADDMGCGDLGLFNEGRSRTPNLDMLAEDGVLMTQSYSASPICSPARASLLTGRYPHRTGAITPQELLGYDRIALDEVTLADALKHGGYTTGLVGKWHNGALDHRHHPTSRGFDEFVGFSAGRSDYYDWILDRHGAAHPTDGRYLTDVFTEEAISFISRHRTKPFFLALMYNAPHYPLQAPDHLVARYQESGFSWEVATIYAMIESLDAGVGRILDVLEDENLAANTILLFSSDNGPAFNLLVPELWAPHGNQVDMTRFNCDLRGGKRSVYEGGIRVPTLFRWPDGTQGGRVLDYFVHFVDWLPTFLEITGIERPGGRSLDGHSIWALIQGEAPKTEPRRFWQYNSFQPIMTTNAAVRDGAWKLVRPEIRGIRPATPQDERFVAHLNELTKIHTYQPGHVPAILSDSQFRLTVPNPPPAELYNLAEDPGEHVNLADAEPARVTRLLSELETWFEQVERERTRSL